MRQRLIQTTLILTLGMAVSASAGPVLLASWPIGSSLSTPQIVTMARPALLYLGSNNELIAPLFEEIAPLSQFPSMVSEVVSHQGDGDFDAFSALLTNGTDDTLVVLAWSPNGPIGGGGGLESSMHFAVPVLGPDLIGYHIDYIQEVLAIDLQTPGSDPFGTGINTDWSVSGRYDFYGTPVPEVSTLCIFFIGAFFVGTARSFGRNGIKRSRINVIKALVILGSYFSVPSIVLAQCVTGGVTQVDGLKGSDNDPHLFPNQCLAATGTNVTIIVEAMADLGCNPFDAGKNPPVGGQCPMNCGGICCDTPPTSKYVTVTANNHSLDPSITNSTNMPANGQFFGTWNLDCDTIAQACLEAGRSPCDPQTPGPNRRIVTIPASTWNSWLGSSGNTMTIRVMTSAAVTSAPLEERSLALYCENLGFSIPGCGTGACSGLCGPLTFSRISVSFSTASPPCNPPCNDGNACTNDVCTNGTCSYPLAPAGTPCGSQSNTECDNPNTCNSSGTCLNNFETVGTPCGSSGDTVCDNPDTCNGSGGCLTNIEPSGTDCDDGLFCNGLSECQSGSCVNIPVCVGQTCCEADDSCISSSPRCPPVVASSPHDRQKNRYISFSPNNGTNATAFRVEKLAIADGAGFCTGNPGAACTGAPAQGTCPMDQLCVDPYPGGSPAHSCWVQAPKQSGNEINTAQCDGTPVYRVWDEPVVHVGDCEIIPTSTYRVYANAPGESENPVYLEVKTAEQASFNTKIWADSVGSFNGTEWTPPNRFTNVQDVLAILEFINDIATKPQFPVVNLQANSAPDSCLNPFVNTADVLMAVRGIAGDRYGSPDTAKITDTSTCGPCPMTLDGFSGGAEGFGFTSTPTFDLEVTPYQIDPEETATVSVWLDAAQLVSGYEVSLDVTGGTTGELTREAITINTAHNDFLFAGHTVYQAVNVENNMGGAVESNGTGVLASGGDYLATFTFEASSAAEGVFEVRVSDERSFILDGDGNQSAHDASVVAYVRVGVECTSAVHCDDGNECTSDACTSGACVNTNLTSGTPCDDGLYCTLTDTCDGSGVCVGGSTSPCSKQNPLCCESTDSCHTAEHVCELEL